MMTEGQNIYPDAASPWRPLRIPLFRNLLIADFASDVESFMTSLSSSTLQIALIQTASALPLFPSSFSRFPLVPSVTS